jgi:acyl-CoA thioester hydrolase
LRAGNLEQGDRSIYRSWTQCSARYGDLDPNGHVNNGAINGFFEEGRVRFRRDRLAAQCVDVLKGFVVAHFSVDYLLPLGYPAAVDIGTAVTEIGRSSFHLVQGVFEDARCIATAEVVAVHFDSEAATTVPLSPELREALSAHRVTE